jgi:hypothetical protein
MTAIRHLGMAVRSSSARQRPLRPVVLVPSTVTAGCIRSTVGTISLLLLTVATTSKSWTRFSVDAIASE